MLPIRINMLSRFIAAIKQSSPQDTAQLAADGNGQGNADAAAHLMLASRSDERTSLLALLAARSHMMVASLQAGGRDTLPHHLSRIVDLATRSGVSEIASDAAVFLDHISGMDEQEVHRRCDSLHNAISIAFSQCSY